MMIDLILPLLAETEITTVAGGTKVITQSGITFGSVLAIVCSWQRNRSILWAILAGILTWFYVIYFAVTRQPDETKGG